jgi:Flp pilus assembly protein CpaB
LVADNKASQMFLGVAVALGILATVMAFMFIKGSEGQDRGPKTVVVVASQDLRPGVAIDPERDFRVEEIPAKFASFVNKTIDANSRSIYRGQKINRVIRAGQPVFLADFAAGGEIEWTNANMRALNITANAGLAIPGDYVKIFTSNGTILAGGQAFRIIAINGAMKMFRQPVTVGEQSQAGVGGAKQVTLEVTEAQASEILKGMGPSQERNYLLICPPPQPPAPVASRPER